MAPIQNSLSTDQPGLGGFSYKKLYNTAEGRRINYFNGQFYYDFSLYSYDNVISNNYPPQKINIGMISNQNFDDICDQLKLIYKKYGKSFGGVFIWEYFDAPDNWSEDIAELIIDICFENYQCAIN